jgi:hypothetical protein
MIPTPKLRFVERVTSKSAVDGTVRTVRVLQQLWIPDNDTYEEWLKTKDGEWRDVPVEKEQ